MTSQGMGSSESERLELCSKYLDRSSPKGKIMAAPIVTLSMTELCDLYNVSRERGYKWVQRSHAQFRFSVQRSPFVRSEDSTAVPQGCSKTKDEKRQEPGRTKGQGLMGG
jgi:hypothetical protein